MAEREYIFLWIFPSGNQTKDPEVIKCHALPTLKLKNRTSSSSIVQRTPITPQIKPAPERNLCRLVWERCATWPLPSKPTSNKLLYFVRLLCVLYIFCTLSSEVFTFGVEDPNPIDSVVGREQEGGGQGGGGRSRRNDKEEGVEGLEGMRKKKEARHLWCRTAAL